MTAEITTPPKAAAALIADAKAAGYEVKTSAFGAEFEVVITTPAGDVVSLNWHVTNVAPNNSMLGFKTSYTAGTRFNYGSAHMSREVGETSSRGWVHTRYPRVKSVRTARYLLNLPIA